MTLANRIKKAREAAKLTKSDLARACGVSPASVTQWENGETKTLEGTNLVKIATATGVEANWIATGKGRIHRKDTQNVSPARSRIAGSDSLSPLPSPPSAGFFMGCWQYILSMLQIVLAI